MYYITFITFLRLSQFGPDNVLFALCTQVLSLTSQPESVDKVGCSVQVPVLTRSHHGAMRARVVASGQKSVAKDQPERWARFCGPQCACGTVRERFQRRWPPSECGEAGEAGPAGEFCVVRRGLKTRTGTSEASGRCRRGKDRGEDREAAPGPAVAVVWLRSPQLGAASLGWAPGASACLGFHRGPR